MDITNLPPLPSIGETGPAVCAVVRLYLAVFDDLTRERGQARPDIEEQLRLLYAHVAICAACGEEFRVLQRATRLVGSAAATAPSARVDAAIHSMLAGQSRPQQQPARAPRPVIRPVKPQRRSWVGGGVAAFAALILLFVLASTHIFGMLGAPGGQTAFTLPANLSWSQYVLYHNQTRIGTKGQLYQVESYDDLSDGSIHVETKMDNQLDVVVVGDKSQMLGLDMIHHVAQMGADQWAADDSLFDLAALRHALQTKSATYIDTDTFKGQSVYRIRYKNGLVMLLDMQYHPVNILQGAVGPGTGEPIYTSVQLMRPSEVSSSMWDMHIPHGFHMGTLPPQP